MVQHFHAQMESRVQSLNLAALAVNKIHASGWKFRSTYGTCIIKYDMVYSFSCLREVLGLQI